MRTITFILIVFLSMFSCSKTEVGVENGKVTNEELPQTGTVTLRYIYKGYFIPKIYKLRTGADFFHVFLYADEYITERDGARFYLLAEKYGEYGREKFEHSHPASYKPYNVLSMKVYQERRGETVDVSDQIEICYWDFSTFIQKNYYGRIDEISKKVSALTTKDLFWLTYEFHLFPNLKDKKDLLLVITMKDNSSLTIRLSDN